MKWTEEEMRTSCKFYQQGVEDTIKKVKNIIKGECTFEPLCGACSDLISEINKISTEKHG